jgi:biopolymer transport protein TolR
MMMRRTRRNARRRSTAMLDISMTPLIDTALTLLVIFMVATPMIHNAIRVTLPKGNAKEDGKGTPQIVVHVDKEHKIFLNGARVQKDQLIAKLKELVGKDSHKMVHVKADQNVPYGNVLELVDHIKVVGGISYVVLATQKYV